MLEKEQYDCVHARCWEIEAAVSEALSLDDTPTADQYSGGGWALEQARFRLTPPEREIVRIGDLIEIDDASDLPQGEFEVANTDATHIYLRDESGTTHQVERGALDIRSPDVWVDRRFSSDSAA